MVLAAVKVDLQLHFLTFRHVYDHLIILENEINKHGSIRFETTQINAERKGSDNGINRRRPVPLDPKGGHDIGAE